MGGAATPARRETASAAISSAISIRRTSRTTQPRDSRRTAPTATRPPRGRSQEVDEKETAVSNPVIEVQKFRQSIWYDNIRRSLITSGELQSLVESEGVL